MKLPRLVSCEKILRGKIFQVAVPYTLGRPFDFIIQDEKDKSIYRIIKQADGFSPIYDEKTKKKKSPEPRIAVDFKVRPAVVIQSNEWNIKEDYPYVIVLPISSIKEEDKEDELIKRMITKNDINSMHYIGSITGMDSYITINDVKRVHKNTLFEPKTEIILSDRIMTDIMRKLSYCLEIKEIPACKECERNCEKCEYKLAVNK